MHSSSRCKNSTYLSGTGNYPVSCKPVYGGELKFTGLTFAMVPCLHQSNVDIKRKLQIWRVQKCIPLISEKSALTCLGRQTAPSHVSQYRAENGNVRKSGSNFCHGTVFAPKQCLYQYEATGMENPKMRSSSRFKNLTYLCGKANYPVSCKPV